MDLEPVARAQYERSIRTSCGTCRANAGNPCRNIASGIEMPPPQVHAMRMSATRSPPYGTPDEWRLSE